jgi:SAM-dependent methyltransferase
VQQFALVRRCRIRVSQRATDPEVLRYQYGTTERLRARLEAHQRYSERDDDFVDSMLHHLAPAAGDRILDVGCGTGVYHQRLVERGVRIVLGVDASPSMVEATQRQAETHALPVVAIQGDAQRLPLPDHAYDRAMANHMLFHVPDQRLVLLVTNGANHGARLRALHEQAARQLGFVPVPPPGDRFNLDHLALVQEVFPNAVRHIRHDAFRFPTAEAFLAYYASGSVDTIQDCPTDGSHRLRLMALVSEQVERIIADEGVLCVPKDAGCFVADTAD